MLPHRHVPVRRLALAAASFAIAALATAPARAQQTTFHLDRLEMPGAPDDGLVLFRPVVQPRATFYAQLGMGYALRPLKTKHITSEAATLNQSPSAVIQDQFSTYASVGVQFLDRVSLGATLPVAWIQDGHQPNYSGSILATSKQTTFATGGPAAGDMRLDARGVFFRSPERTFALGAQLSLFAPTGNGSTTNFGGDGQTTFMMMGTAEYTPIRFITLVGNIGFHFRPDNSINDPVQKNGLGVGNEWRWAVGAFVPLKDSKGFERFRIGGTIFGQTGIDSSNIIGDTAFTARNTPIEWNGEFRMRFGPKDNLWWGAGGGSRLANGYGAPDFRLLGVIGIHIPITDTDAPSPDRKQALRDKWRSQRSGDADGDGIPDDIDACPTEPEDKKGNDPSDGCPLPPDRDGDGIPDMYDRCPDVPEDKDGIDDGDGCPEEDADQDGIPDVTDACPKEPGKPNPDPKRNGCPTLIQVTPTEVFVLEKVHFQTGSANILPDSFPMLQEIANYLKVNPNIKRMSIDGHTDNKGNADMNKKLSDQRAASVRTWLTQHGVAADRLESHGYGLEKPIDSNDTEKGRANNRRVEFKIVEKSDANAPEKSGGGGGTKPPPQQ
jgi:OmpA-OmpF porin, OOP family